MTRPAIMQATTLIAIAAGLLATATPTLAASDDETLPQGRVNIRDIDFTSARSVARLKLRVRRAAFGICALDTHNGMPMSFDERSCYQTALKDGLTQIADRQEQAMRAQHGDLASAQIDRHDPR